MPRRLKLDIPGRDWRVPVEELEASGPAALYAPALGPPLRLVVDVGFGRGEFLMQAAEKEPGTAFLGIEYSAKRVLKMARRLARTELENVRLVSAPAEQVVRVLPAACVHCFWINCPDPWPKKRHHRRRLIQPAFVAELVRCLAPDGRLRVATDHPEYALQVDAVLSAEPGLVNLHAPRPWLGEEPDRFATAYELEWRAEGRALHFFSYAKRSPRSGPGPRELDSPS